MNVKLEDLEINGYKIYQDKGSFNFGIDAVLLANFVLMNIDTVAYIDKEIKICDFCSGNLPIPLIMYAKRKKYFSCNVKIDAIEINEKQVELSNKSLIHNFENNIDAKSICEDIKVINDDLKNVLVDKTKYKSESYDVITCNPPYMKKGSGIVNDKDEKMIARHEVLITFDELCKASSYLLKSNKKFYIIHHSDRFTEIAHTLKKNFFEVKKAQFIYPSEDKPSNLVLIEAVKNANEGVKILEPIIVYDKNGNYTEKVLKIYGK